MDALQNFKLLCLEHPGDIPLSVSIGNKNAQTHFVLGAAIHGNETAAIPAFVKIIEQLKNYPLKSRVTFFIGNYEALLANKRFIQHDLNRLFVDHSINSKEHKRAKEIMQLLNTADYYIDFHQTIQPTEKPFYIFMEHQWSLDFARWIGETEICVIEPAMGPLQRSSEQYVQMQGKPGITLEVGQIGRDQECFDIIYKIIKKICVLASRHEALPEQLMADMAQAQPPLKQLQITTQIKFAEKKDQLNFGLKNLDFIEPGTIIGVRSCGKPIHLPHEGYIFFPKYPMRDEFGHTIGDLPSNICEIATVL